MGTSMTLKEELLEKNRDFLNENALLKSEMTRVDELAMLRKQFGVGQ